MLLAVLLQSAAAAGFPGKAQQKFIVKPFGDAIVCVPSS